MRGLGSGHVTCGPMRGLKKNCMGRGQTHGRFSENIPYSLTLRITRSFTEIEDIELKNMLLHRKYKPSLVDAAVSVRRARALPRVQALKRVVPPPTSKRPVFAVT